MSNTLRVVFGKDQVLKIYSGVELTSDELRNNYKEYSFNTIEEKNAFCMGLEEAIGWVEYCLPDYIFEDK